MSTIIFTDGSSRGNPGPGGWGAIVADEEVVTELGGREDLTTNNRMELSAVIFALESVSKAKSVILYTDSAYVLSGSTRWVFGWQKNNWKTSQKEDVLNRDLWERMIATLKNRKIEWKLLKGHSGIFPNERCDFIATSFADKKPIVLYSGARSRYGVNLFVDIKKQIEGVAPSRVYAYSYVTKVGGLIEVYKTWDECKEHVLGVPGAKFKKSRSPENELEIIEEFKEEK